MKITDKTLIWDIYPFIGPHGSDSVAAAFLTSLRNRGYTNTKEVDPYDWATLLSAAQKLATTDEGSGYHHSRI